MPSRADAGGARAAYERWHEHVEAADAEARAPWHDLLFEYLDPARDLDGRAVLEIGCGRGELACRVAEQAAVTRLYVGADFARSAVALARARGSARSLHRLTWMVNDVQALALPAETFDTILSCETIEHVPDPMRALRELHRVLRRGGRLLLTTPNYLGPFGLYRIYLRTRGRRYTEGGQPICRVTLLPRTVRWIARAGFHVVAADAVGQYVLSPGRVPYRPRWMEALQPVLWPFGLHSIVVAEKR